MTGGVARFSVGAGAGLSGTAVALIAPQMTLRGSIGLMATSRSMGLNHVAGLGLLLQVTIPPIARSGVQDLTQVVLRWGPCR